MTENTAAPRAVRASQEPDHGITIEQPSAGENQFRASCLCGWASTWVDGRQQARDAGDSHQLRSTPLGEVFDELAARCRDLERRLAAAESAVIGIGATQSVLVDLELDRITKGFSSEQLEELRTAMRAAAERAISRIRAEHEATP